ncbi:MAG: diacylglycerol kinase family protein [Actinomycetaceae bacterium]|nr:diacylglycerol kinase family protein [Actinomycetaceae bacterium]
MTWLGWLALGVSIVAIAFAVRANLKLAVLRRRIDELAAVPQVSAPVTVVGEKRRVAVVYNPIRVGDLDELTNLVEQAAMDAGYGEPVWFATTEEDPGAGQARRALALDPAVVIAAGGDGTIRRVAGQVAGSRATLGILPVGTGNLLARNLDLPLNSQLRDLVSVAVTGRLRRIDLGWIRGEAPLRDDIAELRKSHPAAQPFEGQEPFLVIAGMGFDAEVMGGADHQLKKTMGWAAYIFSGLRYLRSGRVRARVTLGGASRADVEARSILFANCARLPAGFDLSPDTRLDDGWLDLMIVDTKGGIIGWGDLVRRVSMQSIGVRRDVLPEVGSIRRRRMQSVKVVADDLELVEADGDVLGYTREVTAFIEAGALQVHVL